MFFNLFKKEENIDYNFCLNLAEKHYPKYLMKIFEKEMGYKFNLKKPKTINEIIQYLKIYDNTEIKAVLTDKTKVNDFVFKVLGTRKYEKEIYCINDTFNQIDFTKLPKRFIIKKNNASRINVRVFDKESFLKNQAKKAEMFFDQYSNMNYAFKSGFELQYKNIPHKLIIEKLYPKLKEFQIICSKGRPIFIYTYDYTTVDKNKIIKEESYELDNNGCLTKEVEHKEKIEEIIDLAKKLSKDFKFVRVDFLLSNGEKILFSEMTFTPYSGFSQIKEYNSIEIAKKIDYK